MGFSTNFVAIKEKADGSKSSFLLVPQIAFLSGSQL